MTRPLDDEFLRSLIEREVHNPANKSLDDIAFAALGELRDMLLVERIDRRIAGGDKGPTMDFFTRNSEVLHDCLEAMAKQTVYNGIIATPGGYRKVTGPVTKVERIDELTCLIEIKNGETRTITREEPCLSGYRP